MTNYDEPNVQHSLTDDQIQSRFRLTEDVVRQAVATARDLTERAARADTADGAVMVPSAQFQTLVESLGVMHKTLMGSINAQVAAETHQSSGATSPIDSALYLSGGLLKAQNGAAIKQAKLIVDKVRRTTTEQGDGPMTVEVPAHALKFISDSVLLTEKLLTPAVLREDSTMGSESPGYRDRGDLGFMSNWYNSGNISD